MGVLTGPKIPVFVGADAGDTYGPSDMNQGWRMQQALIQCNVIDILNDPPVAPVNGDTYIVGVGTGAWAGHNNDVAYWTTQDLSNPTGVWEFYAPLAGWVVFDVALFLPIIFDGAHWGRPQTFNAGRVTLINGANDGILVPDAGGQAFPVVLSYGGTNGTDPVPPVNPGTLYAVVAADFSAFDIKSTSATDASSVFYMVFIEARQLT